MYDIWDAEAKWNSYPFLRYQFQCPSSTASQVLTETYTSRADIIAGASPTAFDCSGCAGQKIINVNGASDSVESKLKISGDGDGLGSNEYSEEYDGPRK
jgi:hypothetical protein